MYRKVCAEKDWNDYRINSRVIVTSPVEISSDPIATNKRPNVAHLTIQLKMKIESYSEMSLLSGRGEGKIERISLSGKFRRARMA